MSSAYKNLNGHSTLAPEDFDCAHELLNAVKILKTMQPDFIVSNLIHFRGNVYHVPYGSPQRLKASARGKL